MGTLINLYANASGLWKKAASFLPLILGIGSLLGGLAGFCNEFGHAKDAASLLAVLQGISNDPNSALVLAGLGALGIHTNHAANAATLEDHTDVLATLQTPPVIPPKVTP